MNLINLMVPSGYTLGGQDPSMITLIGHNNVRSCYPILFASNCAGPSTCDKHR